MRYGALRRMLASRTRQMRERREWSQRELSRRAGLAQRSIANIEDESAGVQLDTLCEVAHAFGVPVWDYLRPDSPRTVGEGEGSYQSSMANDPRAKILSDYQAPPGLRDLASDQGTAAVLQIRPDEWVRLASVDLPATVSKDGYLQLLITLRAITR